MRQALFSLVLLSSLVSEAASAQYSCPKSPNFNPSLLFGFYRDSLQADQIVWSDDDQEFLGSLLSFRERRPILPFATTDKKDFCHRLFVVDSLPEGQHPLDLNQVSYITDYRPGQVGRSYYMKRAGYLIIENILTARDVVRWEKISLNGTIQQIAESPYTGYWSTNLVPSPDGAFLLRTDAWGEPIAKPSNPSGITVPPVNQVNLTVTILDAESLKPVFPIQDLMGLTFGYQASWTSDSQVRIADNQRSFRIDPLSGAINVLSRPVDCWGPVTTSSDWNELGQFVSYGERPVIQVSPEGEGRGLLCE